MCRKSIYIVPLILFVISISIGYSNSIDGENYESKRDKLLSEQRSLTESLKKRLESSNNEYKSIQRALSSIKSGSSDVYEASMSLSEQIVNIDNQVKELTKKSTSIVSQIHQREVDIATLLEENRSLELQFEDSKKLFYELLTSLYIHESTYISNDGTTYDLVKLLLDSESLSTNFQKSIFLKSFERETLSILGTLSSLKENIELQKENIEIQRRSLTLTQNDLNDMLSNLMALNEGKKRLLEVTKNRSDIYTRLLEDEKLQEQEITKEISILTLNIHAFDQAIEQIKIAKDEDALNKAIQIRDEILSMRKIKADVSILNGKVASLAWPVSPHRGISAYFSDSGYRARFGVNHNAIDIRLPHGSPVFAADDGIVIRTKGKDSNDIGYHYIAVLHAGGIETLYGHISSIIINEGQYVRKGDLIGLSGATPGTTGAGLRTTGPHLHFEVHYGGLRKDPLDYLPLNVLPTEYIPADKLSEIVQTQVE